MVKICHNGRMIKLTNIVLAHEYVSLESLLQGVGIMEYLAYHKNEIRIKEFTKEQRKRLITQAIHYGVFDRKLLIKLSNVIIPTPVFITFPLHLIISALRHGVRPSTRVNDKVWSIFDKDDFALITQHFDVSEYDNCDFSYPIAIEHMKIEHDYTDKYNSSGPDLESLSIRGDMYDESITNLSFMRSKRFRPLRNVRTMEILYRSVKNLQYFEHLTKLHIALLTDGGREDEQSDNFVDFSSLSPTDPICFTLKKLKYEAPEAVDRSLPAFVANFRLEFLEVHNVMDYFVAPPGSPITLTLKTLLTYESNVEVDNLQVLEYLADLPNNSCIHETSLQLSNDDPLRHTLKDIRRIRMDDDTIEKMTSLENLEAYSWRDSPITLKFVLNYPIDDPHPITKLKRLDISVSDEVLARFTQLEEVELSKDNKLEFLADPAHPLHRTLQYFKGSHSVVKKFEKTHPNLTFSLFKPDIIPERQFDDEE